MLAKLPRVYKELLLLKENFGTSRRFLVNPPVNYRDYKVRQRRITKCDRCKKYKVRQTWIINYDKFWITTCDKNFKNWITKCNRITKCGNFGLQIATGLQSATDYRVIQYNRWQIWRDSVVRMHSTPDVNVLRFLAHQIQLEVRDWNRSYVKYFQELELTLLVAKNKRAII